MHKKTSGLSPKLRSFSPKNEFPVGSLRVHALLNQQGIRCEI
jgi:hypothetical protein